MNFSSAAIARRRSVPCAILLLAAFMTSAPLFAQLKVLRVDPHETDPAIETVHGPHLALYDPQAPSVHRLFIFFPGTYAKAEGALPITSAFAQWGYHAIALDYEDNVLTVSCAHSTEAKCFDNYREAIVTGAAVSDKIQVDPADSILNRIQKLLVYLVKNDPAGGWQEFVTDGQPAQPAWNRIVVAGHSQGSGHAAYIGKMFAVDRVLMFSGPQDYLDTLDRPAPWLARPSATPESRYFAFLNWNDPFNVHHQIANCMVLMGLSKPETADVEAGQPIHGMDQILVNDLDTRAHGSTLLPRFENVWEYMGGSANAETAVKISQPVPAPLHPGH